MDIKGLEKWLADHNFNCSVAKAEDSNTDYCYDVEEETIYIGTLADNCEKRFTKFARKELGLRVNACIEVLAFLHELGHYKTMPYIDDEILDRDNEIKILMEKIPNTRITIPIKYHIYYRLPMEKVATAWAVLFLHQNPAEAIHLRKLLKGE